MAVYPLDATARPPEGGKWWISGKIDIGGTIKYSNVVYVAGVLLSAHLWLINAPGASERGIGGNGIGLNSMISVIIQ